MQLQRFFSIPAAVFAQLRPVESNCTISCATDGMEIALCDIWKHEQATIVWSLSFYMLIYSTHQLELVAGPALVRMPPTTATFF